MRLPVAILAGGLATRLRPLTESIPKALVPIAGKPFAEHQAGLLAAQGAREVVWLVGYRGEQIAGVLGDGSRWHMRFTYVDDGPVLLGTGGAIRRALPHLGAAFLVMYGDSFLQCDFAAVEAAFRDSGRAGLMTVYRNDGLFDTSNIEFTNGRIVRYDKRDQTGAMRHIDWGLGAFRADAFMRYPADRPLDLARVYQDLLAAGELAAFEVSNRFYEIGSPSGLEETERYLTQNGAMTYTDQYLDEAARVLEQLDRAAIERLASVLAEVRAGGGRLFFLGVGGSAGNCSHAVNDFRKLAGFEAYAPTDNVSELTARINDDGWDTAFAAWLQGSRLRAEDCVFVLSVGGGDLERNVSPNVVRALQLAEQTGSAIVGIVGRDGGYTARVANACVVVPTVSAETVTPHAEAFQSVVWHLLVSHPALKLRPTKWESMERPALSMLPKTVFLDRDGVINRTVLRDGKPYAPALAADVEILPGVPEAIGRLRAAGYRLAVVTNQPDIARGTTTWDVVNEINTMLSTRLGLDDIRVCPHDDADGCDCRKPKPGLLLREPRADMAESVMIGDRWRDIEAGRAAGCGVTILVDYNYEEPLPHEPTVRVASLADAVGWLLDTQA